MNPALFSSNKSDWGTPLGLFIEQSIKYGPFDLDVCALPQNAKCPCFYSPDQDALSRSWWGVCWMNPPYGSEIGRWIAKAATEVLQGRARRVVCLLPARTDTAWWHDWIMPYGQVTFLRGRVKFQGAQSGAPFPSAVVVFE